MSPLDILLVDDHAVVRDSFQALLDHEPDLRVVGSVGDADSAVAAAAELKPHVVLMDIQMPGRCPFSAARAIKQHNPSVHLVFLTAYITDRFIQRAKEAGASAYLSKLKRGSLATAIREAAEGQVVYSDDVKDRILESGKSFTRAESLSRREQEVLRHVASGKTKKQVAEQLGLSIKTVEGHTDHLMKKLGIHNKVELARYAIREGIIEP